MKNISRSYRAWTENEERSLIDMRWNNFSVRHIAEVMNRTESSIHNRIVILKIGSHKKIKNEQKFLDKYIKWVDRLVFRR